jgi:hypothetical protein
MSQLGSVTPPARASHPSLTAANGCTWFSPVFCCLGCNAANRFWPVRKLRTSLVVSTAMLAAAHAFATLQVAPTRNLQTAEAQAQETVKLSISGMV